ncbi:ubiquinone biosynthesis methyltransferase coq5 [Cordyceps fumosorosea ARSEF 2679]|uniref:2-methoxy-6-polyprenyl-1,4-benzoquinol methylase, mitochondrial n=1 Tax=Cordyceps fumosorosea (strain ARSEF 2679) TaxID=1081104 RepID=A0A162IEK6_CORFA|nr:ubiquinone biosynthesis methyltransferase coq5 [Cordyceps fumosorosea ARSEF 2679]OAA56035.1 ubiquinone biosynthesis methyltransferase coq5 [Cordyceps fumosorosea ARSEF 2679]
MASRHGLRTCAASLRAATARQQLTRQISTTATCRHSAEQQQQQSQQSRTTHFGFETVNEEEKAGRVAGVFTSVAESYDKMNDLMSFGVHRLWKYGPSPLLLEIVHSLTKLPSTRDYFVSSLNPGATTPVGRPQKVLDVAGGTGDIAFRMVEHAHAQNANPNIHITVSDINPAMLDVGRQRSMRLPASHQAALSFLEANAERLPQDAVPDASLDLYTVAFGIRNFTDIPAALREAHRVLKPGGVFACMEFSKVGNPLLNAAYKRWSFGAIPLIGQLVAADRDSYQYLVESIERFPSQDEFRDLIKDAGFEVAGCGYENLTGGVAAIHKGIKPLK